MECPYCKEEIKKGAKKCKVCGEILSTRGKVKNFFGFFSGLLSLLIPIGSLGLAYLEYQGRVNAENEREVAVKEKITAQEEAEQTLSILENIPKEVIRETALSEVMPQDIQRVPGYNYLERGDYIQAESEFKKRIEENPKDEQAKRGLKYSQILKKLKRR